MKSDYRRIMLIDRLGLGHCVERKSKLFSAVAFLEATFIAVWWRLTLALLRPMDLEPRLFSADPSDQKEWRLK